ncbi:MAG: FAD-binding protein, partial [Phycisphaerae bacterium]
KFQGVNPRHTPMKIFPAVHYLMGGLWVDYERCDKTGGMVHGSPRNHHSNVPGLFVIGEADYQYHGGNRLGANSLLSCIFTGLFVAPTIQNWLHALPEGSAGDQPTTLYDKAVASHAQAADTLIQSSGQENPYRLHQELGDVMTRNVTVVRNNKDLRASLDRIDELEERYKHISLSDKGNWTNQNLSLARALGDMITMARVIALGALKRDECRGVHYKPEFQIKPPDAEDYDGLHRQAVQWCTEFRDKNKKWLKTTVAQCGPDGPTITYEAVDTSLIHPRPRTYGLEGAEIIEDVWKEMDVGEEGPSNAAPTTV